jgi:hypothetical protein
MSAEVKVPKITSKRVEAIVKDISETISPEVAEFVRGAIERATATKTSKKVEKVAGIKTGYQMFQKANPGVAHADVWREMNDAKKLEWTTKALEYNAPLIAAAPKTSPNGRVIGKSGIYVKVKEPKTV